MKTKSVLLLSTLATAALLLVAIFTFLTAFSLTAGLTLAAPPDTPGPVSVATTVGLAPLGPSSVTLTRSPTRILADGTSTITATVKDELDTFPGGPPPLSASAVYTVEAESSEVITVGNWIYHNETECSASNGQVIYSDVTNAKVSYTFTGIQVAVLYQKQWNTGFMDVLVDGSLQQRVDTYYGGGGKQCQQAVVVSDLPYGPHTVEAVVVGDKNPSSSGYSIYVDAFIISTDISTGCEDAYEPDNDYPEATTVAVPSFTSHNFDFAGDHDWVRFWGTEGVTYTIKTMNLAVSEPQRVDTELVLYWWNDPDLVWLHKDDDGGDETYASKIIWPITTTRWYYVNVGHVEGGWSFSGCDATYDLSIILTDVPCTTTLVIEPETLMVGGTATMTATVVDCSSSPLAGKVITFSTTSGLGSGSISPITATTDNNGQATSYISSTLAGIKLVEATAPNLMAGTDTVTFTAGSPFTITLEAIPDTLSVGGTAVLSATVVDQYANQVPGQVITFSTSSDLGSGDISPQTGTTDNNGHVTSNISSTISGTKLVMATAPNLVMGTTTVTFIASSGCEDAYEPDNSWSQATTVTPPSTTHHNFDVAHDTDWVVFSGTAGITYTIETMNLAVSGTQKVDTKLFFYRLDGSNLVQLAFDDDGGDELWASKIVCPITTTGLYYVNVGHVIWSGSFWGCDAYYDLCITGPPAYVYLPIILKNYPSPEPTPTPTATATPTATEPYIVLSDTCLPEGTSANITVYGYNWDPDPSKTIIIQWDGTVKDNFPSSVNWSRTINISAAEATSGTHTVRAMLVHPPYDEDSKDVVIPCPPTPTSTPTPKPTPDCYPKVEATLTVGVEPWGVAVRSSPQNRVYVANHGSNNVSVIDGATNSLVTTVSSVPGAGGVAYDGTHDLVYVTNESTDQLTVIRASDNAIIDTVDVGHQPHSVAYNPTSNRIYVGNYSGNSVTVLDGDSRALVAIVTDPLGQEPAHLAVNPNTNKIYVTYHGSDRVGVIHGNTSALTFAEYYAGNGPWGISVDTMSNLVYVATIDTQNICVINGHDDSFLGWAKIWKDKDTPSQQPVPMRMIVVNSDMGSSGHVYVTTASDDGGFDKVILLGKGWKEYFDYPIARDTGPNPIDGLALNPVTDRVYVTSRDVNRLTVLWDGTPLCPYNFASEYSIEICRVGIDGDCR